MTGNVSEGALPEGKGTAHIRRDVKDRVFTDFFSSPSRLLNLYSTLHPEDRTATENDVKIETIENVFVTGSHNDLGFSVRDVCPPKPRALRVS